MHVFTCLHHSLKVLVSKASALLGFLKLIICHSSYISCVPIYLDVVCFLLGNSLASEFYTPTFWNTLWILCTYLPMKMEQSVPKRRHIKFRRWGIIQKKAYNIQNRVKVWNQEYLNVASTALIMTSPCTIGFPIVASSLKQL